MKFGGLKSIIYSMNGWNIAQVPGGWCGFRTVGDKTFVLDINYNYMKLSCLRNGYDISKCVHGETIEASNKNYTRAFDLLNLTAKYSETALLALEG